MTDLLGLPAISNAEARILILGSMPSSESLLQQHYYAHPRNQFWNIISAVLAIDPPLTRMPYAAKKASLLQNSIALWDVIHSCQREGSLDTSIVFESITVNNFADFFAQHPQLEAVLFNGRKAQQIFENLVYPDLSIEHHKLRYITLPSTSPAHAAMRLIHKQKAWSIINQLTPVKTTIDFL